MKKIISFNLLLLFLLMDTHAVAQTPPQEWTARSVKKWFKKQEWLGGLQLQPHASINQKTFARQYSLNKSTRDKAFAFLQGHDLQTFAGGKYPINGDNVYATVTENSTKHNDSTKWESHRGYIDLQYVISGEEKMGVSPLRNLAITKEYDASKGLQKYAGKGNLFIATPAAFFYSFRQMRIGPT